MPTDGHDSSKTCSKKCILKIINKCLQVAFTFSFIVLWFFFVFLRNCFKLPDDMYSVMKITWDRRHTNTCVIFNNERPADSNYEVYNKNHIFLIMFRGGAETYPCSPIFCISPILVKLYNICMFQMYEVIKYSLHFLLKTTNNEMKELAYFNLMMHNHITSGNIITANQQSQGITAFHVLFCRGLTSSCLKFFLSEIMTSFQTTSTPSSVSMAKNASSIPGTLRWLT